MNIHNADPTWLPLLHSVVKEAGPQSFFMNPSNTRLFKEHVYALDSQVKVPYERWSDLTSTSIDGVASVTAPISTITLSSTEVECDPILIAASMRDGQNSYGMNQIAQPLAQRLAYDFDKKVFDAMLASFANTSSTTGGDFVGITLANFDYDQIVTARMELAKKFFKGPFVGFCGSELSTHLENKAHSTGFSGGAFQDQMIQYANVAGATELPLAAMNYKGVLNGIHWFYSPIFDTYANTAGVIYDKNVLSIAVNRYLMIESDRQSRRLETEIVGSFIMEPFITQANGGIELGQGTG